MVSRSTSVVVTIDAVLAVCDCEEATLLSDAKSVDDTTVGVADDASQSESRTMTTGDAAESVTKLSLLSNTASDNCCAWCIILYQYRWQV